MLRIFEIDIPTYFKT